MNPWSSSPRAFEKGKGRCQPCDSQCSAQISGRLFSSTAWKELAAVECVATYNRNRSKGECFTTGFGVPAVYDDPEEVLRCEQPDLMDPHLSAFVKLAAGHNILVISVKAYRPLPWRLRKRTSRRALSRFRHTIVGWL